MPESITGRLTGKSALASVAVFASALLARLYQLANYSAWLRSAYGSDLFVDRMTESYRRWLMSMLTLKNWGIYSDYAPMPNQAIIWLPGFNYISIAFMLLSNNYTIVVPRLISLIAGSVTPAIVYLVCLRIYRSQWHAIAGGLVAAFIPWHIEYSTLGVPHALTGFLTIMSIYFYTGGQAKLFSVFSALAILTGYEAWPIITGLLLVARYSKLPISHKLRYPQVAFASAILFWLAWNTVNLGNPFGWFQKQAELVGWSPAFNPEAFGFYFIEILRFTFFIFMLGLVFGLYHGPMARAVASASALSMVAISLAHSIGLDPGDIARVVSIYPTFGVTFPACLPSFKPSILRRAGLAGFLIAVIILSYAAQTAVGEGIEIMPQKAYVMMPEYRTGLALRSIYDGGRILAEGAAIIHYSGLDPKLFISFEALAWYAKSPDEGKLEEWMVKNDVRWLIWERAILSRSPAIFPQLAVAQEHSIGGLRLIPIYEDTLKRRLELERQNRTELWEHLFPGVPEIILYKVEAPRGLSQGTLRLNSPTPEWKVGINLLDNAEHRKIAGESLRRGSALLIEL